MKKTSLLILGMIVITGCTDHYDGSERTVLEGRIISGDQPVSFAKIEVWPTVYNPKDGNITELSPYDYDNYRSHRFTAPISTVTTDIDGNISLSFPRNTETDVYYIKVFQKNKQKYYGFISGFNTRDFYVNIGTLNF